MFFSSACLYLFTRLSSDLMEKRPFLFDQKVIDTVRLYASPAMDRFMLFITEMGSTFMLGLLLVISMIWLFVKRKNLWGMIFYLITVAGGGLLNFWLKSFFERERPNVNRIMEADGFSFPSGHSMGSMTYYGFLGYLVMRSKYKPLSKLGWVILFGLVILLIGISRIYLGVHYPSDVLAGYMAGSVWLVLCISLLEIVYLYKEKKYQSTKSMQKKTEVS
ncbi:phosphatase PAP2 family protein [Metabacillus rhizolycopersici]|uniref:Phosphatase PAP2 family protein n=1 Tax=Metabacillus rhizolycopersici TaxID=2875709 RepID=A0ABS7UZK6_9BACI|nr:phosphatase PAP2 family protein [Metabacillus rhizolycopersici]MBZ5753438.1 phosphatase PAP2 family protein [Metabacillus rhizolycopersici]